MMQREGLSIQEACLLSGLSRAGFYRRYEEHEPRQADVELRDAIHKITIENRCYGYRRVSQQLRAQGWVVNHKRVLRLMHADNLLALRKRRYVLTTDSHHPFAIYPNLVPRLVLNGINQLWVADITYIRLRETFLYLAVILDAYSRKIIGWELGDTLQASLAVAALKKALAERSIEPGIVHHSDRGVQYACNEYVAVLEAHGFLISMSRTGNPYDNAKAESFMKTLKCEEVYLKQYRDREDVESSIANFIQQVYNGKRLHSALRYVSPAQFEAELQNKEAAARQPSL
jgi:transposase InsO family protein